LSALPAERAAGDAPAQPARAAEPDVRLEGLRKLYGDVVAVAGVDLDVARGEFFTMLGPSGSGKTTTLRLIAGFETPDGGRVLLRGRDVSRDPPYARDVNTVFQDYALFPHMSVDENVAYGLKIKKVPRVERRTRVAEALETVRLTGYGERRPAQLSGGQRQRVALARALVNRPQVLLLDEPLGALDLKLRQEMQIELKRIQREVGITFVYVTHDQDEALTMSDRVAVFRDGRIEQVGPPAELYEHPRTPFVAGFVGVSNLLNRDGVTHTVRPEKIRMLDADEQPEQGMTFEDGRVREVVYAGMATRYIVELDGGGRRVDDERHNRGAGGEARGRDNRVAGRGAGRGGGAALAEARADGQAADHSVGEEQHGVGGAGPGAVPAGGDV